MSIQIWALPTFGFRVSHRVRGRHSTIVGILASGPSYPKFDYQHFQKNLRGENCQSCWGLPTVLLRGKWTVAWKCWSNPSNTGQWQASAVKSLIDHPPKTTNKDQFNHLRAEAIESESWILRTTDWIGSDRIGSLTAADQKTMIEFWFFNQNLNSTVEKKKKKSSSMSCSIWDASMEERILFM